MSLDQKYPVPGQLPGVAIASSAFPGAPTPGEQKLIDVLTARGFSVGSAGTPVATAAAASQPGATVRFTQAGGEPQCAQHPAGSYHRALGSLYQQQQQPPPSGTAYPAGYPVPPPTTSPQQPPQPQQLFGSTVSDTQHHFKQLYGDPSLQGHFPTNTSTVKSALKWRAGYDDHVRDAGGVKRPAVHMLGDQEVGTDEMGDDSEGEDGASEAGDAAFENEVLGRIDDLVRGLESLAVRTDAQLRVIHEAVRSMNALKLETSKPPQVANTSATSQQ